VLPFLVLQKAIIKQDETASSNHEMIERLLMDTCVHTYVTFRDFRDQSLQLIRSFIADPEQRTQDIVPSIPVFLLQYLALDTLKTQQENLFDEDQMLLFSPDNKQDVARYAIEEILRRTQKQEEPAQRNTLMALLCPDYQEVASRLVQKKKEQKEGKKDGE